MLIVMLVVAEAAAQVAVAMLPMFMVEVPISILNLEGLLLPETSKKKLNEDLRLRSKYLYQD
jgi:hypothetical protein